MRGRLRRCGVEGEMARAGGAAPTFRKAHDEGCESKIGAHIASVALTRSPSKGELARSFTTD
jgi:hypothetical protein